MLSRNLTKLGSLGKANYNNNPVSDTDAFAYISAVESADGNLLEYNVKVAINNFVIGCKADGIWEPIKASVIMAGARTLNGALVPLKGAAPTNFNFVSGDYNRKTGLVGDGSTKYLDSNRNNNADPQDSKHVSVFVSTTPTASTFAAYIAAGRGNPGTTNFGRSGTSTYTRVNGVPDTLVPGLPIGFIGLSRASSSGYTLRQAASGNTVTRDSQPPYNGNLFVFWENVGTANTDTYSNARLAFYSIGESLDLALLDTRVTQLMTDLGNAIP
jgi:hypothetical protein